MSSKEHKHIGDPMDCLAEECAEVIQILMKIKRFGLEATNPKRPELGTARARLLDELKDVEDRIHEVRTILGAENVVSDSAQGS